MSVPRGLSEEEREAWARLAESVVPMPGKNMPSRPHPGPRSGETSKAKPKVSAPSRAKANPRPTALPAPAPASRRAFNSQLDGRWNRKLKAGQISPDYTLDLHGHSLDGAYERVMSGLDQARAMGARLVLVIAGRERPVDPADRGQSRGAIRAKLLDWLAASRHADAIAAIRRAHIRHGGEGALYLILSRTI